MLSVMNTALVIELAKILLPLLVTIALGTLFLRSLETIKSEVARSSAFSSKWADLFFEAASGVIQKATRGLSLFVFLNEASTPNESLLGERDKEFNNTMLDLFERCQRAKQLLVFAPTTKEEASRGIDALYATLSEAAATKRIDPNRMLTRINEFGELARRAHAEILTSTKGRV